MPNTTVSDYKVSLAKEALAVNPSITSKQFAEKINCCHDSAYLALNKAKKEIVEQSNNIHNRAVKLKEERAFKALEAAEIQIRDRLNTLRDNAELLQQSADSTGTTEDIQAANRAWKELTDYERKVTGIDLAERTQQATAGKTEVNLHLPISPEKAREIIPVIATHCPDETRETED